MNVTVHFFARAKDLVGVPSLVVALPACATVGTLRQYLGQAHPNLADLLEKSALAVNNDYAADDQPLFPRAEVALLPPVSGG